MKTVLYILWQCSWGLVQTFAGALIRLFLPKCRHFRYHGAFVTVWKRRSSAALGMFIFLADVPKSVQKRLLVHEYGHTVQSLLLGPLFLPLAGLPSVLRAMLWNGGRRSYFSAYPEKWANRLGEYVTGEQAPE